MEQYLSPEKAAANTKQELETGQPLIEAAVGGIQQIDPNQITKEQVALLEQLAQKLKDPMPSRILSEFQYQEYPDGSFDFCIPESWDLRDTAKNIMQLLKDTEAIVGRLTGKMVDVYDISQGGCDCTAGWLGYLDRHLNDEILDQRLHPRRHIVDMRKVSMTLINHDVDRESILGERESWTNRKEYGRNAMDLINSNLVNYDHLVIGACLKLLAHDCQVDVLEGFIVRGLHPIPILESSGSHLLDAERYLPDGEESRLGFATYVER